MDAVAVRSPSSLSFPFFQSLPHSTFSTLAYTLQLLFIMFLSIVSDAHNVGLDVDHAAAASLTATAILYEFHSIDAPKPLSKGRRAVVHDAGSEQDAGIGGWLHKSISNCERALPRPLANSNPSHDLHGSTTNSNETRRSHLQGRGYHRHSDKVACCLAPWRNPTIEHSHPTRTSAPTPQGGLVKRKAGRPSLTTFLMTLEVVSAQSIALKISTTFEVPRALGGGGALRDGWAGFGRTETMEITTLNTTLDDMRTRAPQLDVFVRVEGSGCAVYRMQGRPGDVERGAARMTLESRQRNPSPCRSSPPPPRRRTRPPSRAPAPWPAVRLCGSRRRSSSLCVSSRSTLYKSSPLRSPPPIRETALVVDGPVVGVEGKSMESISRADGETAIGLASSQLRSSMLTVGGHRLRIWLRRTVIWIVASGAKAVDPSRRNATLGCAYAPDWNGRAYANGEETMKD
ncbi:hypothetical protein DFP72DRAFT_1173353 [Ephemerocybe angulata]|uniref:Uncharacterized protein n=1 Tax=Ephemerocybe angulata TaxID=980116 RepID=A0A8H6HMG5_9AGAR|nr:hypothetical protein DFP72DRAFT_1173353 [Tulosesus angulatus]